jgi:hypothetical protein
VIHKTSELVNADSVCLTGGALPFPAAQQQDKASRGFVGFGHFQFHSVFRRLHRLREALVLGAPAALVAVTLSASKWLSGPPPHEP